MSVDGCFSDGSSAAEAGEVRIVADGAGVGQDGVGDSEVVGDSVALEGVVQVVEERAEAGKT